MEKLSQKVFKLLLVETSLIGHYAESVGRKRLRRRSQKLKIKS
jgi:hypothetical protein